MQLVASITVVAASITVDALINNEVDMFHLVVALVHECIVILYRCIVFLRVLILTNMSQLQVADKVSCIVALTWCPSTSQCPVYSYNMVHSWTVAECDRASFACYLVDVLLLTE